jgi:hypothetical protein
MLLMGYNFIDVFMNVKKIVTGEQTTKGEKDEKDEFDIDVPDVSIFGKMMKAIRSFGVNLGLIILIFIEALKYIGIQLVHLATVPFISFYKMSANLASNLNLFGKTETEPVPPTPSPIPSPTLPPTLQPPIAPVNITKEPTP